MYIMGARTTRIPAEQLLPNLPSLAGKYIHVTTHNGCTQPGVLYEWSAEALVLHGLNRRWYNRRHHTQRILLSEVREVIWDQKTPY